MNSCTSSIGVGHRLVPHGPRRGWLVLLGLGGALLALVPAFLLHHHDVYSVRNGSGIYRAIELTAGIAIIVGANRLPLHLQFRGNHMAHVWGEVALVLGLAYAHLATLLMATLIGGLIAHLSAGRGLVKTLYNASTATVATLLAGGLVALLGYTPPLHNQVPPVVPLLVASVCFSLFNDLAISAAVAAAQRVPVWGVLRDGFFVHQIMCLASGAVGVAKAEGRAVGGAGASACAGPHPGVARVAGFVLPRSVAGWARLGRSVEAPPSPAQAKAPAPPLSPAQAEACATIEWRQA